MHQIRFPLGLRAPATSGSLQRSRLASLQRSPGPFAVIKGPIIRKGGRDHEKESEVGKGEGAEGRGGSPLPIGESGATSGGRGKGKERSYGWGVQALLFPH